MVDPHVKARQAFSTYEHPVAGPLNLLNPWIRMSETPSSIRAMAPKLGEHTDSVLTDVLGLSAGEVEDLRASSVVR
jgi:succinate--hydroxymethylglutarate CoA-transferase